MCSWTPEMKQWKRLQHLFCRHKHRLSAIKDKVKSQNSALKDKVISQKIVSLNFGKKMVDKENRRGETAVHKAAQSGDLATLQQLIILGGNVNKPTGSNQGYTPPLLYAASNGHLSCVKTLLVAGANVNGGDEWNNTPLLKAACYHHTDCVRHLLECGARVNIANKWGALPLQYAAIQGYNDIVELLLKYGAKSATHSPDTSLPPPVIGAATRCHIGSLNLLLKSEFDSSQLDSSLTMALYYFLCACAGFEYATVQASVAERFTCINLLVNHGAVIKPEHLKMCCYHHFVPLLNLEHYTEMLQLLLRAASYQPDSVSWGDAMAVIFGHMTRLGPYKWDMIKLICSVGFTPSVRLLDSLKYTLTNAEYDQLIVLRNQPRSLTDLSRSALRQAVRTNVVDVYDKMTLPRLVQDVILANNTYFSTL